MKKITCIYCRASGHRKFPAEHVVPRAFGNFRNNLTIRCVCSSCNSYFSEHLELYFARQTLEAAGRLRYGMRKESLGRPGEALTCRSRESGVLYGAKVILKPATTGADLNVEYLPQVAISRLGNDEWDWYAENELDRSVAEKYPPGSRIKFLVIAPGSDRPLRERLASLGIRTGLRSSVQTISIGPRVTARLTYEFRNSISRCVAKIAFNYLAYAMDENTELLLRRDFDAIRFFVRGGIQPGPEKPSAVQFMARPMLARDTREPACGHFLTVGWDSSQTSIVSQVTIYNILSYRIVLAPSFSGVWFDLIRGHHFDVEQKTVLPLRFTRLWLPD